MHDYEVSYCLVTWKLERRDNYMRATRDLLQARRRNWILYSSLEITTYEIRN
jgi:hypothetical protein